MLAQQDLDKSFPGLLTLIIKRFNIKDSVIQKLLNYLLTSTQQGHTSVRIADFIQDSQLNISPDEIKDKLRDYKLVSDQEKSLASLLVLDEGKIYLRRHFNQDLSVANKLTSLISQKPIDLSSHFSEEIIKSANLSELQKLAIKKALNSKVFLLTGSPGTGKTLSLAAIIYCICDLNNRKIINDRVIVAAPTAKAVARIRESFNDLIALNPGVGTYQPKFVTLHKILRFGYYEVNPRANKYDPLGCEWLLIDEASMLSLDLFYWLLGATSEHTRLILNGDKNQLPAISSGAPFRDLIEAVKSPALLGKVSELVSDEDSTITKNGEANLPFKAVELTKNYRQQNHTRIVLQEIQKLFSQEHQGENKINEVLALFEQDNNENISHLSQPENIKSLLSATIDIAKHLQSIENPADMLKQAHETIILTFARHGNNGCESFNNYVRSALTKRGASKDKQGKDIYHGLPFIIKKNDYHNNLRNGDLGVFYEKDNQLKAMIAGSKGQLIEKSPAVISDFAASYAITVHESQGSEFPKVNLVLTEEDAHLNSLELLYTGLSRFRESIKIYGTKESLKKCLATSADRQSGLTKQIVNKLNAWINA